MKETKKTKRTQIKAKEFEVVLLSEGAVLPKKSVRGAIGYDLSVPKDVKIPAHSRIAVPLDIAINLPYGVEAKIEARSGHSRYGMEGFGTKKVVKRRYLGIIPIKETRSGRMRFNADVLLGKVDPNYVDNIHVIIKNDDVEFTIRAGTRIAQMTFYQTTSPFFKIVEKLSCKSRGGGFESTGTGRLRPLRGGYAADGNNKPLGLAGYNDEPSSSLSKQNILPIYNPTDEDPENGTVVTEKVAEAPHSNNQELNENDNYGVHV